MYTKDAYCSVAGCCGQVLAVVVHLGVVDHVSVPGFNVFDELCHGEAVLRDV